WLEIYHGNDRLPGALGVGRYYGAAILLDADDPARVIARSDRPIFAPELEFERQGFVDEVVFPTAVIERDDELWVYYGAADRAMALVAFDRRELLESLR
ncbi:MAG TPA: glycosylase, partial [Planctomycetota bacterium]|nr:glycosylase [Planctomycetota bacterium]